MTNWFNLRFAAYIPLASLVSWCHSSLPPPSISYSSLSICFYICPHFQPTAPVLPSASPSTTWIQSTLSSLLHFLFCPPPPKVCLWSPQAPTCRLSRIPAHSCMWSVFLPFVFSNFRSRIYGGETSVTSCIPRWKCHALTLPLIDLLSSLEQATVGQFQPPLVTKFVFKKGKIKIKLNKGITLIFL